MPEDASPKRGHILDSAVGAFSRYGFRRCSMEDIADAAGMSRPALYQYFRNKAEIFRAASERVQMNALRDAERAGAADGPLSERLAAMLAACKAPAWRIVAKTPHGAELMDLNEALAGDVTTGATERIEALLAATLAAEAGPEWDTAEMAALLAAAARAATRTAPTEASFARKMEMLGAIWAAAARASRA